MNRRLIALTLAFLMLLTGSLAACARKATPGESPLPGGTTGTATPQATATQASGGTSTPDPQAQLTMVRLTCQLSGDTPVAQAQLRAMSAPAQATATLRLWVDEAKNVVTARSSDIEIDEFSLLDLSLEQAIDLFLAAALNQGALADAVVTIAVAGERAPFVSSVASGQVLVYNFLNDTQLTTEEVEATPDDEAQQAAPPIKPTPGAQTPSDATPTPDPDVTPDPAATPGPTLAPGATPTPNTTAPPRPNGNTTAPGPGPATAVSSPTPSPTPPYVPDANYPYTTEAAARAAIENAYQANATLTFNPYALGAEPRKWLSDRNLCLAYTRVVYKAMAGSLSFSTSEIGCQAAELLNVVTLYWNYNVFHPFYARNVQPKLSGTTVSLMRQTQIYDLNGSIPSLVTKLRNEVNGLLATLPRGTSELGRIFWLHNLLTGPTGGLGITGGDATDIFYSGYNYDCAYRLLTDRTGMCFGFSDSFTFMLWQVGVESRRCMENAAGPDRYQNEESHAWNQVRVNGTYYFADPQRDWQWGKYYRFGSIGSLLSTTDEMQSNAGINVRVYGGGWSNHAPLSPDKVGMVTEETFSAFKLNYQRAQKDLPSTHTGTAYHAQLFLNKNIVYFYGFVRATGVYTCYSYNFATRVRSVVATNLTPTQDVSAP